MRVETIDLRTESRVGIVKYEISPPVESTSKTSPTGRQGIQAKEPAQPQHEERHTRTIDMFLSWKDLAAKVADVVRAEEDPELAFAAIVCSTQLKDILPTVRNLFLAAFSVSRRARRNPIPPEQNAGREISTQIQRFCESLMGQWFTDWLQAWSVFLVNYVVLLKEHPGEHVLIARDPKGEEWRMRGIASTSRELVAKARELGCAPGSYIIPHVIEGADQLTFVDLTRPEGP